MWLIATAADIVLNIVGQLRHTNAQLGEEFRVSDTALEHTGVLKSQENPNLTCFVSGVNIGHIAADHHDVAVGALLV